MAKGKAIIVRKVENQTFRNAVVHVTGNAFLGCEFYNCTFVFHGLPFRFDTCKFDGAHLWRLEFTVYDADEWDQFMSVMASLITKSLPRSPKPE